MDIITAIHERRSIREFLSKKVLRKDLEKIIEAASCAPSDENSQPWHFTVVESEGLKKKIGELSVESGQKYFGPKRKELLEKFAGMGKEKCEQMVERFTSGSLFSFLETVPTIIIISSDDSLFSHCSTGAAIQNLMLSAIECKLSTCWTVIGLTDDENNKKIKDLVNIPQERVIISVLAIGYPAQSPKPRGRKEVSKISTWL